MNYWFKEFRDLDYPIEARSCQDKCITIDGLAHGGEIVLIAAAGPHEVISWKFVKRENSANWSEFLSSLPGKPKAVTGDGQKGMMKALRKLWPDVPFQRCCFHIYNYCKKKLKAHPKSKAAKTLKVLSILATKVKTLSDAVVWLTMWDKWNEEYGDYLQEKTSYVNERGRRCWHYTHRDLHAAWSHLKNALPHMFNFLFFPEMPSTSNILEGGINSPIRNQLHFHRGATTQTQRQIISVLLRSRQR